MIRCGCKSSAGAAVLQRLPVCINRVLREVRRERMVQIPASMVQLLVMGGCDVVPSAWRDSGRSCDCEVMLVWVAAFYGVDCKLDISL